MTSAQAGTVAAAAVMHSGEGWSMNPRCISIITKAYFFLFSSRAGRRLPLVTID